MAATLQGIKQRFGIIGNSDSLIMALSKAIRVAPTDLSVLISGESGVGKEVFSKIIHALSPRKHNTFIAINTGAIPEGTINSELFGHEKGSFTGATSERRGYFETANGGTIFLDEIGEMPLDTQAFLLRVLESGEFIRVGSSKVIKTDVRVIAATNVSLEDKIRKGKFREDLFYRLNTVPIIVPALYERPEDIYLLFRKFSLDFAEKYRTTAIQLDESAKLLIRNYRWPGNVRELKNVVEQLSVLTDESTFSAEKLLLHIPKLGKRNLPAMSLGASEGGQGLYEREILYKLLFDMKKDMNDLKSLVFELIQANNLDVPNFSRIRSIEEGFENRVPAEQALKREEFASAKDFKGNAFDDNKPILLRSDETKDYERSEVIEESLSLEDMEKELIAKALKKHKGRRKEAADDLGISERTLYRKIKQYEI